MAATTLRIGDFVPAGHSCHFHRTLVRRGAAAQTHRHDFHEIFWVEDGEGWEVLDGTPRALERGSLALVHGRDEHTFGADPGRSFILANLAFAAPLWDELRVRCFADAPDAFAFEAQRRLALKREDLAEQSAFAEELGAGERGRAALERFLLNLMHLLARQRPSDAAPAWLREAVTRLDDPRRLQGGTHALVELCARSAEHVAREARRCYGRTPTDLVNDARIAWAARRLAASDDAIIDICLECGLSNLGHFYRLFRARHHASPQRWRERQRRIVHG
jgi:AraC family cel operon transcriptional repressor